MRAKKAITVVLPNHPPTLTPEAARILLQILRDAAKDVDSLREDQSSP